MVETLISSNIMSSVNALEQGNNRREQNSTLQIDADTMKTFPNLVVVNFDASRRSPQEKIDGTLNSLQFLNLGSQEISAMRMARNFTWLNIKESEWIEICGGPNCPSESMNRNIHDYLKLQMELASADTLIKRNKLKSNLTVSERAQNSLRERCDKRLTKRPLRTEGELNVAMNEINAAEKLGIWFKHSRFYLVSAGLADSRVEQRLKVKSPREPFRHFACTLV